MEASRQGVRALVISLVVLLVTTVLQFTIVLTTQSVALLADTVHNFSDALTAVPLMVAFYISRRPASRRYTYGYGRSEDLAGLFIVFVVLLSAVVAALSGGVVRSRMRRGARPTPLRFRGRPRARRTVRSPKPGDSPVGALDGAALRRSFP